MCSEKNNLKAALILSGDPKQLEAVTKSENAVKLGFRSSFMEYLFSKNCYQRDERRQFDAELIVQLTANYRNHPAILDISNVLIYDKMLKAKASEGKYYKIFLMIMESGLMRHNA